jgi:hypothetical protein
MPRIRDRALTDHYTMRHIDLHAPEPREKHSVNSGIGYPGPRAVAQTPSLDAKPVDNPSNAQHIADLKQGPQTLVQPDLPKTVALTQETPVPTVVIWSPEKTEAKTIVPPPPQKQASANVQASIIPPNEEVNLSDLGISPTDFAHQNQPVLPSTTTPITVKGPDTVQQPPQTTSDAQAKPTAAAVLSLSDLHMKQGTITLPPVNQTASGNPAGSVSPAKPSDSSQAEKARGAGNAPGAVPDKSANIATAIVPQGNGESGIAHPGAVDNAGLNNGPSVNRITMPKDGKFASIVVGAGQEEKYPEAAAVWNGRLAYTVFLHVGLAKSWILQYSLSRADDAAAAGNATRLDAPWPYDIVRPNIAPGDINADALMVHGTVNAAGRFETLAVVFPPEFTESSFVLSALQQWQFRPAMQSGQNTPVEVLIIIPEEDD